MRSTPLRTVCPSAALLISASALFARTPADPYADEPYWYQPGHPIEPAEASAIETRPGFVAERILTVPRELGSWTALAVDSRGRLLAAAQHEPGLYRITLPPLDQPGAETQVEKLGGAAATMGWAHGLLVAFDSLYVTVAEENDAGLARGVYRLFDDNGDDQYERVEQLLVLDGSGEHGPHNLVVAPDGRSLLLIIGNGTRLPDGLPQRPTAVRGIDHVMPPGFESSRHSAQGWVLQLQPDGSDPQVLCSGLRNPFHLAVNRAGDVFTFDSDAEWDLGTPWYRPTRIYQLVSGGEYGWRDDAAVWPDHFEDVVPPVLNIGPGSPTGMVFGDRARFPVRYRRALFVLDWTFATVHAVFLEPNGAGYGATSELFLGGVGLPLTHVVIGHDGAMYLAVGGRRLGSALYRVHYTGPEPLDGEMPEPVVPPLHALRRELEDQHGATDGAGLEEVWPHLGHPDRAIRFAARIAVESRPLALWRERVLTESDSERQFTGFLALARQGEPADLPAVLRWASGLPWPELTPADQLRGLRIVALALARRGEPTDPENDRLRTVLRPLLPHPEDRVMRELARVLAFLGDGSVIAPLLDRMTADRGVRDAAGSDYYVRNPKYGKAVRDMLEAAPLLERMHHAQMLLWLAQQWSPEERRRYFELIADAVAHSKGGHLYAQFWDRIREAALERMPAPEREGLARLSTPVGPAERDVPRPQGPGREWTVDAVLAAAAGGLRGRDAANGRAMFAAAACNTCHRLGAEGGSMGPDLTGVGQRFTLRDLVEAIVEPSRAVSDQYRMTLLQLADGRAVSGRILSRDTDVTRIAPNLMRPGQTEAIPVNQIVREQEIAVSTMPSGLLDPLNETEVLDLLAHLVSGGDPNHPVFTPTARSTAEPHP